jgi:hypothetical protein
MPNVFVDVDLITWYVLLLSLPYCLWLQSCWVQTVPNGSCWLTSIWQTLSFLHAATLHVVFRILTSRSWCWFGCVFTQAGWLLYNDSTSDVHSFEGHSWWPHADYLPSLRLRYSPSNHAQNTGHKCPNLKRGHTEVWIKHGRHGSRTWYLDILLKCHTFMITFFEWNTCLVIINICN